MLIKTIMFCALLTLIAAYSAVAYAADPDTSGWAACVLYGPDYDQARCINKIQTYTGADDPPTRHPVTETEAIAVYQWAIDTGKISDCTAVGAGGALLPADYIARCPDYAATPTATWTPTPPPTPDATPTIIDDPIILGSPWWLPIVLNCDDLDHQYMGCGR